MAQYPSSSGPNAGSGAGSGGNSRKSEPINKRSYTLRLTISSIITAIIVLVISLGWSFVLGVMVGRGYNPEKKISQLANLFPKDESDAPASMGRVGDDQPVDTVMRAEDLSYAASLKGKPGQGKLAPPPPKAGTEPKPKNMQNATAVVTTTVDAASLVSQPAMAQPPSAPRVEATPTPKAPAAQNFDFTFQVATFKTTSSVDDLRAKLEGAGLRTRMETTKGKTVLYKVLVLYRGTADAAQALRQQLVDMGLGQPIQRGKSPVGGSGKKS